MQFALESVWGRNVVADLSIFYLFGCSWWLRWWWPVVISIGGNSIFREPVPGAISFGSHNSGKGSFVICKFLLWKIYTDSSLQPHLVRVVDWVFPNDFCLLYLHKFVLKADNWQFLVGSYNALLLRATVKEASATCRLHLFANSILPRPPLMFSWCHSRNMGRGRRLSGQIGSLMVGHSYTASQHTQHFLIKTSLLRWDETQT